MIVPRLPSFHGHISAPTYAVAAPALILAQHALVALAYAANRERLVADAEFWLLPLRRLAELPELPALAPPLAFAFSLALAWLLAILSFRRALGSAGGYGLAAFSVVPLVQVVTVAILALMPRHPDPPEQAEEESKGPTHVAQGLLAGVALLVFAVLISALTFGAYGWGLFVMTPFLVGVTTAYIANRDLPLDVGRTMLLVLAASGLGALALLALALEGLACILMAMPLALPVAMVGGAFGRAVAMIGHRRGKPLLSVAMLPALFVLESAMPPEVGIETHQWVDIAAPPAAVWRTLTSDAPIAAPAGLLGASGLAYPVRAHIIGEGVGARRLGHFSTGTAHERVTAWAPGRALAFDVLTQPPSMEEMSPYRRVYAPHVIGYFETSTTRFDLEPLPSGGTRLRARAAHVLRLEPVLYWEPLARWAIRANTARVLSDIKARSER